MNIESGSLKAPTKDTLNEWLNIPRLARCGEFFTPSEPMWWPDKSFRNAVNWQAAIRCVPVEWQSWLHAALAYRMVEVEQSTVRGVVSILSLAAQEGLDPLNEDHIVDLRERFSRNEFSSLCGFMVFWRDCESLEKRPPLALIEVFRNVPRKRASRGDPILSLDPVKGPFNQVEQDALYQWLHMQFCHQSLDVEQYLYLRLMMIYGQRGTQLRMMVFGDFTRHEETCKIRIYWAKQRNDEDAGFRKKSETFCLDKELFNLVRSYRMIVLERLKEDYPNRADWDKAIMHVPLFRRRLAGKNNFSDGKAALPILVDDPNFRVLEDAPHPRFHVSSNTIAAWMVRMEKTPDFPVSPRTQQPLKISKGHRFKYTLGTDLSNAGADEWTIARALFHSRTDSIRKYRQVSEELMAQIDEKMNDHLALVVGAFNGTIIKDRASAKNGDRADRQIEDLAVCGADEFCHLDAPFSCYACSKFQPLFDADHSSALARMEHRREQTIVTDKTTGVLWDRAILACRKIILDCKAQCEVSHYNGGGA